MTTQESSNRRRITPSVGSQMALKMTSLGAHRTLIQVPLVRALARVPLAQAQARTLRNLTEVTPLLRTLPNRPVTPPAETKAHPAPLLLPALPHSQLLTPLLFLSLPASPGLLINAALLNRRDITGTTTGRTVRGDWFDIPSLASQVFSV